MTTGMKAKMKSHLNDAYRESYAKAFAEKFGVACTVKWNFLADELYSEKADGSDLTDAEAEWSRAFSDGYAACSIHAGRLA